MRLQWALSGGSSAPWGLRVPGLKPDSIRRSAACGGPLSAKSHTRSGQTSSSWCVHVEFGEVPAQVSSHHLTVVQNWEIGQSWKCRWKYLEETGLFGIFSSRRFHRHQFCEDPIITPRVTATVRSIKLRTLRSIKLRTVRSIKLRTVRSIKLRTVRSMKLRTVRSIKLRTVPRLISWITVQAGMS
ncbi:hypothetical protein AVEN_166131-1 [Araneus ventricosus]|uniref:Uncharacterized protein n=1 Tax=Araneus ventricosus TaxID=182803 RepID=A0A4Y2SP47_ARAVE|nr:hypothetical protein AVEN_166131-1 [Araneus ventricosus]